jgi:hypothetical protein
MFFLINYICAVLKLCEINLKVIAIQEFCKQNSFILLKPNTFFGYF